MSDSSFDPDPDGLLTVEKASSGSGFVFRFTNEDENLTDPEPASSHVQRMVVELPDGVTLNPSIGAGLGTCASAAVRRGESAFNPPGAGCPNPRRSASSASGCPIYDRSPARLGLPGRAPREPLRLADRGLPGRQVGRPRPALPDRRRSSIPDPGTGNLDRHRRRPAPAPLHRPRGRLPLAASARRWSARRAAGRRGPRSPSPPGRRARARCTQRRPTRRSPGIDDGPCPAGTPPFAPDAIAGGVNSNVNSYTPYFVHLIRKDTEQEITSYSLVLPKGITGKLAGIPFCPEAAIAAARANGGLRRGEPAPPARPPPRSGARKPATGSATPSPTPPGGSTSPVPTRALRSPWSPSTPPRSGPSTSARS